MKLIISVLLAGCLASAAWAQDAAVEAAEAVEVVAEPDSALIIAVPNHAEEADVFWTTPEPGTAPASGTIPEAEPTSAPEDSPVTQGTPAPGTEPATEVTPEAEPTSAPEDSPVTEGTPAPEVAPATEVAPAGRPAASGPRWAWLSRLIPSRG